MDRCQRHNTYNCYYCDGDGDDDGAGLEVFCYCVVGFVLFLVFWPFLCFHTVKKRLIVYLVAIPCVFALSAVLKWRIQVRLMMV